MAPDPDSKLATRRIGAPAGVGPGPTAVDAYVGLQLVALDRLVDCGLGAGAATLRLRAEAQRLVGESGLDDSDARQAVEPILASVEGAIGEVQDELQRLVLHALRQGRTRLGLA